MVKVTIADETKVLNEVTSDWITSTISKNRVMDKENPVEINIDSDHAKLDLYANCPEAGQAKASNDIENRILFNWDKLVLSKDDLDPGAIYEFLKNLDHWISYIPKEK